MFARVGVIAAHNRKKYKKSPNNNELIDFTKGIKQGKIDVLTFGSEPIALWITGLIIFGLGIFLMYNFSNSNDAQVIKYTSSQKWWTVLVSCTVFLLGILVMLYGVRRKIIIDKAKRILVIKKTNFLCKNKIKSKDLTYLEDIVISKEGVDNISTNTIHYKLYFVFPNKENVGVIENPKLMEIQKRYIQIMEYLDMSYDVENIPFYDNTVRQEDADEINSER